MRGKVVLVIYFLLVLCSPSANAQDSIKYKWEKFCFSFGGFLTSMDSNIGLYGTESGLGLIINMEEALNLTTSSVVIRSEVEFNFGSRRRSHIRMGYFGSFRSSSKVIEEEIGIGDIIIPINASVTTQYNLQIIRAMYDYSIYKDDRMDLALSGGFYILPVSFSLNSDLFAEQATSFIAPLPVLGIRNTFFISPKLLIKQNIEVLYLKTSSFEGNITDLNLYLEYNPFKHFGLGLGYNAFRSKFSTFKERFLFEGFEGSLRTGISGLLFYGKFYF